MGGLWSAADPNGSARTNGEPLANPPGVIFPHTQADLLWTPPESDANPKSSVDSPGIRHKYAAEPWIYLSRKKSGPLVFGAGLT